MSQAADASGGWNRLVSAIVMGSLHHNGRLMVVEPVEVRLAEYAKRALFYSLIALKNKDHLVMGTDISLAAQINMHPEDFRMALEELMKPDSTSRNQEEDGRRVVRVPGGLRLTGGEQVNIRTNRDRGPYWKQRYASTKAAVVANGGIVRESVRAPKPDGLKGMKIWELTEIKHHTEMVLANLKNDDSMKTTGTRGQRILTDAAKAQQADYERQITAITVEIASRGKQDHPKTA